MTEKEIQNYIWKHKEEFDKFLQPIEFPEKPVKSPWEYSPTEILYYHIIDKYKAIWEAVQSIDFFGCEVSLKKEGDSTIRTDFLGAFEGQNGIVIVELKKSEQTERQSYTELLAYGNHIRNLFSPMCKTDIVYLLIAPMKERIVREATIHTLLYDKNNVCALIPSWENDDISTLNLRLWIPSIEEVCQISEGCFTEANFDVLKIAWDGLPGIWSPEKEGEEPDEDMKKKLNWLSSLAIQLMEEQGMHGFAYCSQAYSDRLRDMLPLTNSLILVAINPYKATKNRVLLSKGVDIEEANGQDIGAIKMLDVIPELANKYFDSEKEDILPYLDVSWSNILASIGYKIVNLLTKSIDRDSIETSYGIFNWETYQRIYIEDTHCYNFDISLTGLLRELFIEYSILDWEYIKKNGYEDHPIYDDGDFPNELIDIIHSQYYIREFIKRLQDPYHKLQRYV